MVRQKKIKEVTKGGTELEAEQKKVKRTQSVSQDKMEGLPASKRKKSFSGQKEVNSPRKMGRRKSKKSPNAEIGTASARFIEDDQVVLMDADAMNDEFFSDEEGRSKNNNATVKTPPGNQEIATPNQKRDSSHDRNSNQQSQPSQ